MCGYGWFVFVVSCCFFVSFVGQRYIRWRKMLQNLLHGAFELVHLHHKIQIAEKPEVQNSAIPIQETSMVRIICL